MHDLGVGGQQFQPLQQADGAMRRRVGAAASADHGGVRVRAEQRDRAGGARLERQKISLVLQQHDAATCDLEGNGGRGRVVQRNALVFLLVIEPAEAHGQPQQAPHLVVDRRLRNLARGERRLQLLGSEHVRRRHLHVEPCVGCVRHAVGREPVRHGDPVELPVALQNVEDEPGVLGAVHAVHQVVGRHQRARAGLGHRGLERRQVDLVQGALIQIGARRVARVFHEVDGKVFDRRAHALILNAADVGDAKARGEERIFPGVFEVPTAVRGTVNVDAGGE